MWKNADGGSGRVQRLVVRVLLQLLYLFVVCSALKLLC
jgi:hypothetical protein